MPENRGRGERKSDSKKRESTSSPVRKPKSRSRSRTKSSRARSRSRSRSKRAIRARPQEDEVVEEGQEIMLIEELLQKPKKEENVEEQPSNQDNQQETKNNDSHNKKKTRMVQQVLLVPTNGDLLMERYRQAAQRSLKARALLDQALNWDTTVVNRDRMARDAFKEAGKARLLIETEKTPELIAMLTDAKVKGEEEAFRAQDTKVAKLIPSVKLPSGAAETAAASAIPSKKPKKPDLSITSDQITENPVTINSVTMANDPAMRCFENVMYPQVNTLSSEVTTFSGEDGDDEYDADEHVYRAKQYLEFILPDLGDMRDDSSMAPKAVANPRSILQNYQMMLLQQNSQGLLSYNLSSGTEGSGICEISSLGFDESYSFDNISSRDADEEVFSMTSLNEIMDTPLEAFDHTRIQKMSSKQRRKLTIRMSFGSKSLQADDTMVSPKKEEVTPETTKPIPIAATSPVVAVAAESTPAASEAGPKNDEAPEKKRLSLSFPRIRTNPILTASPEEHNNAATGGFFSRFRSMKKSPRRDNHLDHDGADAENTLHIIGPVLSDLSENHSHQGGDQVKPNTSPAQLGDKFNKEPEQKTSSSSKVPEQEPKGQVQKATEQEKKRALKPKAKPKDQTQQAKPKDQAQQAKPSDKVTSRFVTIMSPRDNLTDDIALPQSVSMGSSNQDEEDEDDDRYKVSVIIEGEGGGDDDEVPVKPSCYTPVSLASIEEAPSRYSPIHCANTPSDVGLQAAIFNIGDDLDETNLVDVASVTLTMGFTSPQQQPMPPYAAAKLQRSDLPSSNPSYLAEAKETRSRAKANGTLSSNNASSKGKKKKKKKQSLMNGLFHKKGREDASVKNTPKAQKSRGPVRTAEKSANKSVEKTDAGINDKSKKVAKKRSSVQVSMARDKGEHVARPHATLSKEDHIKSPITKNQPHQPSLLMKKGAASPKIAPVSSLLPIRMLGSSPAQKPANESSPALNKSTPMPPSQNKGDRRKSLKALQQSKEVTPGIASPIPFHPKTQSKDQDTSHTDIVQKTSSPLKRISSSQSNLPMALQLSRETVEIMAMEECEPNGVPPPLPLKALPPPLSVSEPDAAQTRIEKPPAASSAQQKHKGKSGKRFDKRQLQEANNNAPNGSTPKNSPALITTSWLNNIGFHISRKVQSKKKSNPAKMEQNVDSLSDNNENAPPLSDPSNQAPDNLNTSPRKDSELTKLTCDTERPQHTISELPAVASNPLLPYQLLKQLEEQARIAAEIELSVKEAAERSIIRSTTNAMRRLGTPLSSGDKVNEFAATSPRMPPAKVTTPSSLHHDDEAFSARNHRSSISTAGNPWIQSPTMGATSSSPYSRTREDNHHRRPDADGLNARAKDLREFLGVDEEEDLDPKRSRSFLSRITQGTYRQDHDLPDP